MHPFLKFYFFIFTLLTLFTFKAFSNPINLQNNDVDSNCDYKHCPVPDPNKLNIHLIAHTHDDVGWLKTVDQYYYGSKSYIQIAGVQYILDTVVRELLTDPKKRFIYVETAYFWKWWNEQSNAMKINVNQLVQNGQLEFVGGGWSMNDEGATHYNSVIDQMTWGFKRLWDAFGKCGIPKVAWHIDPFGHSREIANLFAHMNFDGFFFCRIDFDEHKQRIKNKTLEMVWKGSDDLGKSSNIFTGILDNLYSPPNGYCYDLPDCDDDPIIDDIESEEYNADEKINGFIKYAKSYAEKYSTNNLLFAMGDDFQYQSAHSWYKNLDKLIKHVNERESKTNIRAFYSTPSCYLYSLYLANQTYTVNKNDFFPYSTDQHSYFTGFLTSRPALKYYERYGNNFLQYCKQLDVVSRLPDFHDAKIAYLREAMGVLQHHDAVSGTERQRVAYDYALKLSKGIDKCKDVVNLAFEELLPKAQQKVPKQIFCDSLNISACEITEGNDPIAVTIYNPIARPITQYIRLPVTGTGYKVLDPNGKSVAAYLVPIPEYVIKIPGRISKATNELLFQVNLPAVGFSTYLIQHGNALLSLQFKNLNEYERNGFVSVSAKSYSLLFNPVNGQLNAIETSDGKSISINQSFHYYKGFIGDNRDADHRASGAYVFRPDGQSPTFTGTKLESKIFQNEIVTEVHQQWNSWIHQVIRVYKHSDFVEFDWVIGPIQVDDRIGKEIISRFDSNLTSKGLYYTDANGRQIIKRARNFRPSYKYTITEPTSGNYYPINSRIFIQDQKQGIQMTVLNDRSQGGGSLMDGSIELMVHRRLLNDDGYGVGEPLNEPGFNGKGLVIRGQHYLLISNISDAPKLHRDFAQRLFLRPIMSFSNVKSESDYYSNFRTSFTALESSLPSNVHLLTLEQWRDDSYLLRLEHFYQTNEDPQLSKSVTVNLKELFAQFDIISAEEMTLGANQILKDAKRLQFKTETNISNIINTPLTSDLMVTLNPMQIRTFVIKFN